MNTHTFSRKSILILSDHQAGISSVVDALADEGFQVEVRSRGTESFQPHEASEVDLLLAETGVFSLSELSQFQGIRQYYPGPFLLAVDELDEMMQVLALEMGIDDIVIKPINTILLLARIRALLRRPPMKPSAREITLGELEIDQGLRRVRCRGQEVQLTSREFDLLWFMAQHARKTVSRDELYQAVFGIEYNGQDRSIDMYVSRLRHKLEALPDQPRLLKTVRGVGYLLAATD